MLWSKKWERVCFLERHAAAITFTSSPTLVSVFWVLLLSVYLLQGCYFHKWTIPRIQFNHSPSTCFLSSFSVFQQIGHSSQGQCFICNKKNVGKKKFWQMFNTNSNFTLQLPIHSLSHDPAWMYIFVYYKVLRALMGDASPVDNKS